MPELPEVETLVRGLQADLPGRRILSIRLGKTDFIDDPAAIEREIPGRRIESIQRFGKFILLRLVSPADAHSTQPGDNHSCQLLVHLGMTGHLSPHPAAEPPQLHTHACFTLDDGRELRYTDVRRFGRMALLQEDALGGVLGKLGLDPLEATLADFRQCFAGRRAMIKALLLNQSVLRGLGNIYADESLWRARIHPARHAAALSPRQVSLLYRCIRRVLDNAIRLRGSSISDFVDASGLPGEYQLRHRAYGREGKGCFRCGTKIRRILMAGRSSHFCPRCQPAPRRKR